MSALNDYIRRKLRGERPSRTALDESIYRTFTDTVHGRQTLDYLIHVHLMGFSAMPDRSQLEQGKALVVQDLVARMDRYKNSEHYGPLTEQTVTDQKEKTMVQT